MGGVNSPNGVKFTFLDFWTATLHLIVIKALFLGSGIRIVVWRLRLELIINIFAKILVIMRAKND